MENDNTGKKGGVRLKTVAEMRQRQQQEFGPVTDTETVSDVESRWQREERRHLTGSFLGKAVHAVVWLVLLVALVVGGWLLWKWFKGMGGPSAPEDIGGGEVVSTNGIPVSSSLTSPTQTVSVTVQDEQRRIREKRLAEQQRAKDDRVAMQLHKMAYEKLLRQFREARMDYWKNAPAADRPDKVKEEKYFNCLIPEKSGFALLTLVCKPEVPMTVQRLSPSAGPIELTDDEFKKMIADVPYLVMREDRSYFCTPWKLSDITRPAPTFNEAVNPSKDTFGALYKLVCDLRIKRPDFLWQVSFLPRGFETTVEICKVKFGETVPRSRFYPKVREAMRTYRENQIRREASRTTRSGSVPHRTVVLYDGNTIRKDIHGVTQVPRSFTYAGSNRNKYPLNSHSHRVEARKEEEARAKWQKLYTEAVRQENAAREANRGTASAIANVSITSDEIEDVLNVGKMVIKATERD